MTEDMITLCTLVENSENRDFLREMIGFTAQRLMELEVEGKTGAPTMGKRTPSGSPSAMATATASGRRAPVPSNCASPSCARAATSLASWSRGGWPRRRSPPSSRRPMYRASPPARSTTWSRRWG